ncbi:uncharacterized protein LOC111830676 [Capsella rubella]|uniref:uncharacterized protein LOC111830676 n=1 Tax=Capsella rubella TaxID=81985 RepID=UPI000CD5A9FD|nr:uncharacterized protein LOC111830676 [Capsella rubella]
MHNWNSRSSFWNQVERQGDSWNWKCILRLRGLAKNFINCRIGDGRKASFWFDSWTSFGPLIKYIGPEGPRSLRVNLNAKVSEVCNPNGWTLAAPRTDLSVNLQVYLSSQNLPSASLESDIYEWVVADHICEGFSAAKTWSALRPRENKVDWYDSIWFKGAIPRNALTMWAANLNRLPTKGRLCRWGMNIDPICDLCSVDHETKDHLFLFCDYALFIWHSVSRRLHLPQLRFPSWSHLISWTKERNSESPTTLRKLVVQAVIYALWKQRNNLLHNQVDNLPSIIFKGIDREVKNSITARRLRKRFRKLMSFWLS